MTIDKDLLFKPRLPEQDVEVPGIGTVRVRGLSRAEVMTITKATDAAPDGPRVLTLERKMLSMALLDPELTEAEVGQWQRVSTAGELEPVTRAIQTLSGMDDDAPKSGLPGDGSGPGAGVRTLPGSQAGDDGGRASGADQ